MGLAPNRTKQQEVVLSRQVTDRGEVWIGWTLRMQSIQEGKYWAERALPVCSRVRLGAWSELVIAVGYAVVPEDVGVPKLQDDWGLGLLMEQSFQSSGPEPPRQPMACPELAEKPNHPSKVILTLRMSHSGDPHIIMVMFDRQTF